MPFVVQSCDLDWEMNSCCFDIDFRKEEQYLHKVIHKAAGKHNRGVFFLTKAGFAAHGF